MYTVHHLESRFLCSIYHSLHFTHLGKNAAKTASDDSTKAASPVDNCQTQTGSGDTESAGEWCEASTAEGYVYYWNTVTLGENFIP